MKRLSTLATLLALLTAAAVLQAGQPSRHVQLIGTIRSIQGKLILQDEGSQLRSELRGQNIAKLAGKRVRVNGTLVNTSTPGSEATQVVAVSRVRVIPAASGGKAAAAGVATGVGKGAAAAVAAGVAGAATLGSLYATGAAGKEEKPASRP